MNNFGTNLVNIINELNISISDVSNKTGISQNVIEFYIENKVIPKDGGKHLATALNVPLSKLFCINEEWNTGIPNHADWGNNMFLGKLNFTPHQSLYMYLFYDKYGWYFKTYTLFSRNEIGKTYINKDINIEWQYID